MATSAGTALSGETPDLISWTLAASTGCLGNVNRSGRVQPALGRRLTLEDAERPGS
jgi:hypothetical protein